MKTYEVTIYALVEANNLEEAEMKYADGDYIIDYHEIHDYDEDGNLITFNQFDIEEMEK